ncbi:hypothetical protein IHE44_0015153 [Lamprotornis superbus]|uniref:Uncharacterized protein n=1 Tax=Lamprotornis superbus TaxID=245042 RepID=A0A835NNI1_9PASS|nr:hypothetical protein IHE44_0015153 [Lamprotornis superbus]
MGSMLKSSSKEKYPLFTFVKGHSRDYDFASSPLHEENDLYSEDEKKRLKRFSTEEFAPPEQGCQLGLGFARDAHPEVWRPRCSCGKGTGPSCVTPPVLPPTLSSSCCRGTGVLRSTRGIRNAKHDRMFSGLCQGHMKEHLAFEMSYVRAGADPNPSPNSSSVLCLAGAYSPMAAAVLEGQRPQFSGSYQADSGQAQVPVCGMQLWSPSPPLGSSPAVCACTQLN